MLQHDKLTSVEHGILMGQAVGRIAYQHGWRIERAAREAYMLQLRALADQTMAAVNDRFGNRVFTTSRAQLASDARAYTASGN